MKHFILLILLCCCAAGCATVDTAETAAANADTMTAEIVLGEKMLDAFQKNDASAFLKHLTGDAQKNFGEKEFRVTRGQITEAMGEAVSYEYLTSLEAPGFRSHLWKVTFERGKTLDQTKKLRQQTLFRLVLVSPDNKKIPPFILSFSFL